MTVTTFFMQTGGSTLVIPTPYCFLLFPAVCLSKTSKMR